MRFLIFCGLVILSVARAEYPANIPKCKNGDSPCLTKVASEILEKHSSGIRELNLLPLEPLHVKKLALERNPSSPVNVDITFIDTDMFGLKNMKVLTLKGLSADLSERSVVEGKIPELRFVGSYKVDGHVLVLPVVGDGPFEIIMKNVNFKFAFDLKAVEKNGQTYAALEHVKLDLDPEHVHYKFDNLFNGDKVLGDNVNILINENWSDIYSEVRPGLTKGAGRVVKNVFSTFFEKYPYSEYFE